jgi:hypothetical protein
MLAPMTIKLEATSAYHLPCFDLTIGVAVAKTSSPVNSLAKLPLIHKLHKKAPHVEKYKFALTTVVNPTAIVLEGFIMTGKPAAQRARIKPAYRRRKKGILLGKQS